MSYKDFYSISFPVPALWHCQRFICHIHTCVYFLQSLCVYSALLYSAQPGSACSVFLAFCFVPLRRLLTNFVCLLWLSRSLSLSPSRSIFTTAFNIQHLFIVGVERLPGAPFFVLLLLLLCHCVFAYPVAAENASAG